MQVKIGDVLRYWKEKIDQRERWTFSGVTRLVRRDFSRRDLVILFFVAFLVGVFFKQSAREFFTIGYEDYKLTEASTLYDLNQVEQTLLENGGTLAVSQSRTGLACMEE